MLEDSEKDQLLVWAQRAWKNNRMHNISPDLRVTFIAKMLGNLRFEGGKLTNTIPYEERLKIAEETRDK